jgi:GNAT superfamily N-acetyltransferase
LETPTPTLTLRARLHRGLWSAGIRHSHFLVLRCPLGPAPPPPAGLELEELRPGDPRIRELERGFDRGLSEGAIAARFRHGLRFLVLGSPGGPVATTWVLPAGERFVEELGAGFAVPTGAVWLRDLFVAPAERGRGRFAELLDAVRARWPERSVLWSDVRHGNRPSLRAHLAYGFEVVSRHEVVHLFSRVLVRLRWSRESHPSTLFGGERRVVRSGELYRRFAEARRA